MIMDENPEMVFTEVSRELGRRWALVDISQKNLLKKQAAEFNNTLKQVTQEDGNDIEQPFEASTSREQPAEVAQEEQPAEVAQEVADAEPLSNLDVIGDETNSAIDDVLQSNMNDNHLDADQLMNISIHSIHTDFEEPFSTRKKSVLEKSTSCPLCDYISKESNELAKHIKTLHKFTQSTLKSCGICKKVFIHAKKLQDHMIEYHEAQDVADQNDGEEVNEEAVQEENFHQEVVLVKLRKLAWPGLILKREGDVIEVRMIADDTIKVVSIEDIESFQIERISNTKNSRLKKAFAKAAEIMKK